MSHDLRLTYFDFGGRAEPIRIALHMAGIPFEDRRISFGEFGDMKRSGALPLGSVPILEHAGVTITQCVAILRYVAKLGDDGLYPEDPLEALVVDSVMDTFNDTLSHALHPSMREKDPERKLAMRRDFVAGPMARCCRYVEGLVAGPLLLGERLTTADLVVGLGVRNYQSGRLDGIDPSDLASYPRLLALADAMHAHPKVQAYYAQP